MRQRQKILLLNNKTYVIHRLLLALENFKKSATTKLENQSILDLFAICN